MACVGVRLLFSLALLPYMFAHSLLPSDAEAVVRVGRHIFRVQALARNLLRVEHQGLARGWEDRLTFLVRERTWPGSPLIVQSDPATGSVQVKASSCLLTFNAEPIEAITITVNGQRQWIGGFSLAEAPAAPRLPYPTDLPQVWSLRDSPRVVPPSWGPTPSKGQDLPFANTSGFDLENTAPDAYFFFPNTSGYESFRKDLLRLTGPIPELPDYAFGSWFSWYHAYSQTEKQQEVETFFARGFPLDVAGMDMDWRQHPCYYKGQPPDCSKYTHLDETEYQVDTLLLPNLTAMTEWLHLRNVSLYFNDHPMEKDPSYKEMSPKEIRFRWEGLTSLLAQGLDFWWFDCHWNSVLPGINCSGEATNPDHGQGFQCVTEGVGIDYVTWEKYVQFEITKRFNSARQKRSLQLGCSNSNHLADHRYPVWWTGDNHPDELDRAVSDMIEGGLQLKPYVHPDCTGHMGYFHSAYPSELYVRWLQFCSFGSILRVHSNALSARQPWIVGDAAANITRSFMRMRLALAPMLISAGRRASQDGTPLVRRLDLEFAKYVEASAMDQYLLGDDLLVAPVFPTSHEHQVNALGNTSSSWNRSRAVWIPPGKWEDVWTGELVEGPVRVQIESPLERMPLFHRRPGILICASSAAQNLGSQNWGHLFLEVFPEAGTIERTLYDSRAQEKQEMVPPLTSIVLRSMTNGTVSLKIVCTQDELTPGCRREWTLRFHMRREQEVVAVWTNGELRRKQESAPDIRNAAVASILNPMSADEMLTHSFGMAPGLHGATGIRPPALAGDIVEVSLPPSDLKEQSVLLLCQSHEGAQFV